MEKKVVYLMGAGGMIDFGGPTTANLTNICSEIIIKHHFEGVLISLDETYGKGNYNFETIIASIEALLDWAIAYESRGYISVENTNVVVSLFYSKFQTFTSEQLWNLFVELINCVIKRVSEYDYEASYEQRHNELKIYFNNEFDNKSIKIYSLNYDRLIPHIFGDTFYDATLKPSDLFSYDLKKFINSKQSYFNLHGSIYLNIEIDLNSLSYKVMQHDIPQSLTNALKQEGGSPNDIKMFSPIIAGYSKSQRLLSEPFNFGLGAFMEDCNLSDELVIVGYSFSDPHINSVIRNYFKVGKKEMTIIDKRDWHEIASTLTYEFHTVYPFHEEETGAKNEYYRINLYTKGFLQYVKTINNTQK